MWLIGMAIGLLMLTLLAIVVRDWISRGRVDIDAFESHIDDHMETITEYRVRRNLHQGG